MRILWAKGNLEPPEQTYCSFGETTKITVDLVDLKKPCFEKSCNKFPFLPGESEQRSVARARACACARARARARARATMISEGQYWEIRVRSMGRKGSCKRPGKSIVPFGKYPNYRRSG